MPSEMTAKERSSFLESLQLAEPSSPYMLKMLSIQDSPRTAYIVGGSAISFVAGVSPISQRDALNSTLLAQLAANKQFDRENDTVKWYGFYKYVLENVGWVLQDFAFNKFNASGSSFTMDKVVLDLIAAIASGDEIAAVQATLDAMRSLAGNDGRIVLFETSSHSASKGNFQISVANEVGGVMSMGMAASYFSTQQNVTHVLWFSYSSSQTDYYDGSQTMTLNKQIYQQVRQQVVDKLGDKARTFVQNLPI
jgi:hypothetical protein